MQSGQGVSREAVLRGYQHTCYAFLAQFTEPRGHGLHGRRYDMCEKFDMCRLAKERSAEDHLFGDKDRFVTSAYKNKLQASSAAAC